jgi:hypothetical protein
MEPMRQGAKKCSSFKQTLESQEFNHIKICARCAKLRMGRKYYVNVSHCKPPIEGPGLNVDYYYIYINTNVCIFIYVYSECIKLLNIKYS